MSGPFEFWGDFMLAMVDPVVVIVAAVVLLVLGALWVLPPRIGRR
jgi:hypothetical protein